MSGVLVSLRLDLTNDGFQMNIQVVLDRRSALLIKGYVNKHRNSSFQTRPNLYPGTIRMQKGVMFVFRMLLLTLRTVRTISSHSALKPTFKTNRSLGPGGAFHGLLAPFLVELCSEGGEFLGNKKML
jgi:hypothetical protein